MASTKLETAAQSAHITTELNSLANAQAAIASAAYDNSAAGALYLWCDFELNVTFGSAPTAGNLVEMYLLPAEDGTNYADGSAGASPVTSAPNYIGAFPCRAVTTAQRIVVRGVPLPPCPFKVQLVNNSAVAFPASGSTLNIKPYRTATA